MSKKIVLDTELGNKSDYPQGPISTSSDYSFPEFSFTEDEPCDLPDSGTLTIEYRLIRHSEDTRNEDRPKYSYTVCVKKLVSAVSGDVEAPSKKDTGAADALDALAAEKEEGEY